MADSSFGAWMHKPWGVFFMGPLKTALRLILHHKMVLAEKAATKEVQVGLEEGVISGRVGLGVEDVSLQEKQLPSNRKP